MTISKERLYDALDQDSTTGMTVRAYVGLANHSDVWKLHEALGAEPLVTGWSVLRTEGGFREDGYWTTEPGLVIEFVNRDNSIEASDAFVEAVAKWARQSGEQTVLLTVTTDQFTTMLDLKSLLEDITAGV